MLKHKFIILIFLFPCVLFASPFGSFKPAVQGVSGKDLDKLNDGNSATNPNAKFALRQSLSGFYTSLNLGANYSQFKKNNSTGSIALSSGEQASITQNVKNHNFINAALRADVGYGFDFDKHFYLGTNIFVNFIPSFKKKYITTTAISNTSESFATEGSIKPNELSYGIEVQPGFVFKKYNTFNLVLGYVWQGYTLSTNSKYGPSSSLISSNVVNKKYTSGSFETGFAYFYNLSPTWYLNAKLLHTFSSSKQTLNQNTSATRGSTTYTISNSFTAAQQGDTTLLIGITHSFV